MDHRPVISGSGWPIKRKTTAVKGSNAMFSIRLRLLVAAVIIVTCNATVASAQVDPVPRPVPTLMKNFVTSLGWVTGGAGLAALTEWRQDYTPTVSFASLGCGGVLAFAAGSWQPNPTWSYGRQYVVTYMRGGVIVGGTAACQAVEKGIVGIYNLVASVNKTGETTGFKPVPGSTAAEVNKFWQTFVTNYSREVGLLGPELDVALAHERTAEEAAANATGGGCEGGSAAQHLCQEAIAKYNETKVRTNVVVSEVTRAANIIYSNATIETSFFNVTMVKN